MFYLFYKDKRHDLEDYFTLDKEIERLIAKGYLKQFVERYVHIQ
jgi:hypothetical protein